MRFVVDDVTRREFARGSANFAVRKRQFALGRNELTDCFWGGLSKEEH